MMVGRRGMGAMGLALLASSVPARAQPSVPPGLPELASRAARRFPQAVRVGDLSGRQVLEPTEAQHVLGRVEGVSTRPDGGLDLVMRFGGWAGFGTRPIAVPLDAVALLGQYVAVLDYTPQQLAALPDASAARALLPPDASIRMGLVRPFH